MKPADHITLSGGHSEDVFVWCEDCRDIIGVNPETLAAALNWVERHNCAVPA